MLFRFTNFLFFILTQHSALKVKRTQRIWKKKEKINWKNGMARGMFPGKSTFLKASLAESYMARKEFDNTHIMTHITQKL